MSLIFCTFSEHPVHLSNLVVSIKCIYHKSAGPVFRIKLREAFQKENLYFFGMFPKLEGWGGRTNNQFSNLNLGIGYFEG